MARKTEPMPRGPPLVALAEALEDRVDLGLAFGERLLAFRRQRIELAALPGPGSALA